MNTTFWDRLQTIDRRIIYGILLVVILIPLFFPDHPADLSQQAVAGFLRYD